MRRAEVRSFPWQTLHATTHAQAAARVLTRRAGRELIRLDLFTEALGALVGASVTVSVGSVVQTTPQSIALRADAIGLLLERDDALAPRRVVLEAEPALAAALVARALRRSCPAILDGARPPSGPLAGALGAVVVTAARRSHVHAAPQLCAVGAPGALLERLGVELHAVSLTVVVDGEAFGARAIFPAALVVQAKRPPWDRPALAAMGTLPLALQIVACASTAALSDVAALVPGDAWMPGTWMLGQPGTLAGKVTLVAPRSEHGIEAELAADGRLAIGRAAVAVAWNQGTESREGNKMSTQDRTTQATALTTAMGDVPVVVRVEIGAVQMRAQDWAELEEGDVVATDQKIGEPVVLRVGGVEVARGELVDIDGEIGVRILSRSMGETS